MAVARGEGKSRELRGHHVLFWLLGFFGLMLAANGVFIYFAVSTFPGEETEQAYERGLEFNRTLEARAQQDALGWNAEAGLEGEPCKAALRVRLSDSLGRPVTHLALRGVLGRTTTSRDDIAPDFARTEADEFLAVGLPLGEGLWELRLELYESGQAEPIFKVQKTLTLGRTKVRPGEPPAITCATAGPE